MFTRTRTKLALIPVFLGIGVGSAIFTAGQVLAISNPVLAMALWNGAEERSRLGEAVILEQQNAASARKAAELSRGALDREPINVIALRTLGLAAALTQSEGRAVKSLGAVERLSRRDIPTEMFFIEQSVAAGNVRGALTHYDRVLRVSPAARPKLFDRLLSAAAQPGIGIELAGLLARRPVWSPAFTQRLIVAELPDRLIFDLVQAQHLDPGLPNDRGILVQLMLRLVGHCEYGLASTIYTQLSGTRLGTGITDGSFATDPTLPVFQWQFADQPDLSATRDLRGETSKRMALSMHADNGKGGEVARQTILLRAGNYVLSGVAGSVPSSADGRTSIAVSCAAPSGATLLSTPLPPSGEGGAAFRFPFRVTGDRCVAQRIVISMSAAFDEAHADSWIGSLRVSPR